MDRMQLIWQRVRDMPAAPSWRREPFDFAVWQAWRTHCGDHGETATERLMCLPSDAQEMYFEAVEAFDTGALSDGRTVPVWRRAF